MPSVLLVEDDDRIKNMYAFALSHAGYQVELALSGAEALTKVQTQTYDFILLDMMMMQFSGLDFLRHYDIKTLSPHTQVIALTNIDNPKVIAEAQALGAAHYLNKSQTEPSQLLAYLTTLSQNLVSNKESA